MSFIRLNHDPLFAVDLSFQGIHHGGYTCRFAFLPLTWMHLDATTQDTEEA